MNKYIYFFCAIVITLSACRTSKNLNYFVSYPVRDSSHMFVFESYEVPILVGDQLSISVSALNIQSAAPYNMPGLKPVTVDAEGKILYPQLGAIRVAGLTRPQLRDLLISKLKTYLTDPIVSVDFTDFKVTVLGEVGKQGTITVPDGRLNILEALAQSGNVSTYGDKAHVMIIREINGTRNFGWVNLLSHDVFTTPYYRLRQNDIIYVKAVSNKPTVGEEVLTRRISILSSVLALVSTLGFLVVTIAK